MKKIQDQKITESRSQGFDSSYFKANYANYARQNPAYKSNAVLRLIGKYRPSANGDGTKRKLLDVGCAYCAFLSQAKKKGYSVQGCDVGKDVIAASKDRFKLKNCGINDLKYKNSEFDIITVLDVIEHVKDYRKAFDELNRVMDKNGIVVFVMPVYDGFVGMIVNRLDKDPTHINKFSRQGWLKILDKEFEILEWKGIFRYFLFRKIYINLPTKIFRNFTPAIMVVCRKR